MASVLCEVFVSAGDDPTRNEFDNMFVLELKPKGLDFHNEKAEEDFQISQVAMSVQELREYLCGGKDVFDGEINWVYIGTDEEEERFVKPLPSPFNDIDAYVKLCWVKEDVFFDDAAQLLCNLFDKAFSELELQKLDVGELRIIRAVKGGDKSGYKKPDIIDDIWFLIT